jgi:hypothetical protein
MNPAHSLDSTTLRSILTLFSHLRLGLPHSLWPWISTTKIVFMHEFSLQSVPYALPIASFLTWSFIFGEENKLRSSSLLTFSRLPLFHPILLSILFSSNLSLWSCPSVTKFHTHTTLQAKYILIFRLLEKSRHTTAKYNHVVLIMILL